MIILLLGSMSIQVLFLIFVPVLQKFSVRCGSLMTQQSSEYRQREDAALELKKNTFKCISIIGNQKQNTANNN